jgi:hypothetical protein
MPLYSRIIHFTSLFFHIIIIIIIIIIKNDAQKNEINTQRKMGRGFKEEVERQGNAWAIHTEYR